jgi:hypothetical protein
MYPTEEQDIYIREKEEQLNRSLYATLINTYLGRANELPFKRKFPKNMTNEDAHEVYFALKNYTELSEPLMWKREMKEKITKEELFNLLTQYRILIKYYELPGENEIIEGVLNDYKRYKS